MEKPAEKLSRAGIDSSVIVSGILLIFSLALGTCCEARADLRHEINACENKASDAAKLDCFSHIALRHPLDDDAASTGASEDRKDATEEPSQVSMLEKLYELTDQGRKDAPMVEWHNPNYFLFVAYNSTPNRNTMLDADPNAVAQNTETKFQLSGKVRPLPGQLLGRRIDFWVGYTQRSFWQLYNKPFSSPFRDTNYEPEGFFSYKTKTGINLFGLNPLDLRVVNAGFVHQSNGRSKPLSRSWNRWFAEFCFEKVYERDRNNGRNEFNLFVKAWYRLPENEESDDNPDIIRYMGYGEIRGIYYWKDLRCGMMLRNNLRGHENKGAIQLDVSVPFPTVIHSRRVYLYLQYFNGYGECLLDYNSSSNRYSAGIMIHNW